MTNKIDDTSWLCEKFGINPEPKEAPKNRPESVTYKKQDNLVGVKVKKLREDVIIPEQVTDGSVGFDLRVVLPIDEETGEQISKIRINPNERVRLSTELIFELPKGYFMQINPRSSMGIKKGLVLQNTTGILDSDYRGICYLFIKNTSDLPIDIENQERLAQAIILPYPEIKFNEVKELSKTERGEGGFGSSGTV